MTTAGSGSKAGDGHEIVIVALAATGWVYILSHFLSAEMPGAITIAGPTMQVVELVKENFGVSFPYLQLGGSLCVTAGDVWASEDFVRALGMWMAMVLAMMLPTLLWTRLPRGGASFCRFLGGYVAAWVPFCGLAVLCQWLLRRHGFLDEHMASTSYAFDLFVLSVIGVSYLMRNSLSQVARHIASRAEPGAPATSQGLSCGLAASWSCAPIMAPMFIFGLMNLTAMAVLTGVMLMQARRGKSYRRTTNQTPASASRSG